MELKEGDTIHFKLKLDYRSPRITGVVKSTTKKMVWATIKQVKGEVVGKSQQTEVCIPKRNIF